MTRTRLTEIPVVFYRTSGGAEPVIEGLRGLPAEDRRAIGTDPATVHLDGRSGCRCAAFGQGLWEVRSALPKRRIARLLFFAHEDRIGVVHGFIKKTQRTPADDLDLARRRMKEMTE